VVPAYGAVLPLPGVPYLRGWWLLGTDEEVGSADERTVDEEKAG
jgi:hypothetical protein